MSKCDLRAHSMDGMLDAISHWRFRQLCASEALWLLVVGFVSVDFDTFMALLGCKVLCRSPCTEHAPACLLAPFERFVTHCCCVGACQHCSEPGVHLMACRKCSIDSACTILACIGSFHTVVGCVCVCLGSDAASSV